MGGEPRSRAHSHGRSARVPGSPPNSVDHAQRRRGHWGGPAGSPEGGSHALIEAGPQGPVNVEHAAE
eukprot:10605307-Alexandrium_andersonii.AAC.1